MIARIWHGRTDLSQADAYLNLMQTVAIPDYQATPGNQGVYILRRLDGEQAHFLLLTLWESKEAIKAFAGESITKAKYYSFDKQFLLEQEPEVQHYEVFATP
ncbi:antibiotic biosynthesis monooxygenase [Ktedonosporobacter rubrisoli]|uniref:Antibiotic biosynthesis monooxygenase n=1 Tax=Ktedonosporobacter rubrisoli TaxID=2509675 RepID=A0A4P6JRE0_KTERU|nr:antibiotic biosynthesis monooxygenase [Ktedonosporobacter rubrisoli]QBD77762.1 antibiotic biosynthesis monooxygenase [Ktedonosporobacter rubrisoli]